MLLTFPILSFGALKELATKQDPSSLRFISRNGKYTYYMKKNGSLALSTSYKVKEVLKGNPLGNYLITSGPSRKKLVIEHIGHFHNYFSLTLPHSIFIGGFGGDSFSPVGKGIAPKLHLDDLWLQFYSPRKNLIQFISTSNAVVSFSIQIPKGKNPYFSPAVTMLNQQVIFYSSKNKFDSISLIKFDRITKKKEVYKKWADPLVEIELCKIGEKLFVFEKGILDSRHGTKLTALTPSKDKSETLIYQSPQNDFGNMICNQNEIFFIKTIASPDKKVIHEVAKITLDKQFKVDQLSHIKYATQLISMDGLILTPFHGKYLVVKGKEDLKNRDRLLDKKDQK